MEIFTFFRMVGGGVDVLWIRYFEGAVYSETLVKQPLRKKNTTKVLKTEGSLVQVKSIAECSSGALCNTFDLH